ncbi:MAG: glycosyltransferase [Streptosporangiaceae bacterium]
MICGSLTRTRSRRWPASGWRSCPTRTRRPTRPPGTATPSPSCRPTVLEEPRSLPPRPRHALARPSTVALIPAYNEADKIRGSVLALQDQSTPPTEIIVVANNCTDDTAVIARDAGAVIVELRDNPDKKAGALNHAGALLPPPPARGPDSRGRRGQRAGPRVHRDGRSLPRAWLRRGGWHVPG